MFFCRSFLRLYVLFKFIRDLISNAWQMFAIFVSRKYLFRVRKKVPEKSLSTQLDSLPSISLYLKIFSLLMFTSWRPFPPKWFERNWDQSERLLQKTATKFAYYSSHATNICLYPNLLTMVFERDLSSGVPGNPHMELYLPFARCKSRN